MTKLDHEKRAKADKMRKQGSESIRRIRRKSDSDLTPRVPAIDGLLDEIQLYGIVTRSELIAELESRGLERLLKNLDENLEMLAEEKKLKLNGEGSELIVIPMRRR